MKAQAFEDWDEDKDYEDMLFAPAQMKNLGQTFAAFNKDELAVIESVIKDKGGLELLSEVCG
jgi:hypothetical protein